MSIKIENLAHQYNDKLQECIDIHAFDPSWNPAGDLTQQRDAIKEALCVSAGNTEISYSKEDSWTEWAGNIRERRIGMIFKIHATDSDNNLWEGPDIYVPYGASPTVIFNTIQKAYADVWVRVEEKESKTHINDRVEFLADFYKKAFAAWTDLLAKLNANKTKLVLNMMVVQKTNPLDRINQIQTLQKEIRDIEYSLSAALNEEEPAKLERVLRPRDRYTTLSIFSTYSDYYSAEVMNRTVKFYKSGPSMNYYVNKNGGLGHCQGKFTRYLPATPYWSIVKDNVTEALKQKADAQKNNP